MVLFVFQIYLVCNLGKFINSGLGTVRSEKNNSCVNDMDTDVGICADTERKCFYVQLTNSTFFVKYRIAVNKYLNNNFAL